MAIVRVGQHEFDVDVVVFDKDGTLVDFHAMWGRRAVAAVEAVLSRCGYDDGLQRALYAALGYDPVSGETDGGGPLAMVPLDKTDVVMATVLYQRGLAWDHAEQVIAETFSPVMAGEPDEVHVRPLGDIRTALTDLHAAGVKTVVATSDNRDLTLKMLHMLGVLQFFELIYCGDDDTGPRKPSPALLRDVARRCSIRLERLMMVSDTVSDLSMASAVRAAARIGVIGGATRRSELVACSDALISSIDELKPGSDPSFS